MDGRSGRARRRSGMMFWIRRRKRCSRTSRRRPPKSSRRSRSGVESVRDAGKDEHAEAAALCLRVHASTSSLHGRGKSIAPFNFPATIPLWTIPLALVTGNTLVINPSERDPAATIIIAELCVRAGACASPYSPFPTNILSPFLITLQPIPSSVFHSKQLTSTLTVKYAHSSSLFHLVTYLTDGCKGLPPGALNVVHSAVPTSSWPGMARGRTYTSCAGTKNEERVQCNGTTRLSCRTRTKTKR
ncbi:hypothetical protein K438DRAFT_2021547 [Mycena galopus ATCC 62051]|nr:hypothetical protein K438DRAFT_2021547 [Mycena galopus ATCC 62051]